MRLNRQVTAGGKKAEKLFLESGLTGRGLSQGRKLEKKKSWKCEISFFIFTHNNNNKKKTPMQYALIWFASLQTYGSDGGDPLLPSHKPWPSLVTSILFGYCVNMSCTVLTWMTKELTWLIYAYLYIFFTGIWLVGALLDEKKVRVNKAFGATYCRHSGCWIGLSWRNLNADWVAFGIDILDLFANHFGKWKCWEILFMPVTSLQGTLLERVVFVPPFWPT